MNYTINFEFERETKGTVRYKEVSDATIIGVLYIRKTALGATFPQKIIMNIQGEENGNTET